MNNIPCVDCGYEPPKRIRRKRFRSDAIATKVLSELADLIGKCPWFVSLGMNPDTIIVETNNLESAWNDPHISEFFQGYTVKIVLDKNHIPH